MTINRLSVESEIGKSRQKLALTKKITTLVKGLVSSHFKQSGNTEIDRLVLDLSKLLALSVRKIAPGSEDKPIFQLIEAAGEAAGGEKIRIDETKFAEGLVQFFEYEALVELLQDRRIIDSFITTFKTISANENSREAAQDPLFVGWVDQLLTKEKCDYGKRRQMKSMDELASLTQWYTPDWIANFLAEEVFEDSVEKTFLDPASGAGHILIPVFQKMVSGASVNCRKSVIEETLAKKLFGLDVDRKCVELAGFSTYLAARDLLEIEEFPMPNLFWFESDTNTGSYNLGTENELRDRVRLAKVGFPSKTLPLNTIPDKFDAVAFNPPYLSHRLIPGELKDFLKIHYPNSHYDLYTSFIELAVKLLARGGRTSFICQQSFLSIQRYESFRRELLNSCHLITVAQLGTGVFATKSGEKVNSAVITLGEGKIPASKNLTVFKKEGSHLEIKNTSFEDINIIAASIPGYPIATWCPKELAAHFKNRPSLSSPESGVVLTNGLFTCNNEKFVRHFLDVDESEIADYVPYDKGGNQKWFATTPYLLKWIENGDEIRRYRKGKGQSAKLPGREYYFKPGVTYSYIGPSGFTARLLSEKAIFDIASSALFATDKSTSIHYLLGFLNSSLVKFTLGVLNPTVNFQIGDLRKIPYIIPDEDLKEEIGGLAKEACSIAKHFERYNIESPSFEKPLLAEYIPGSEYGKDLNEQEFKNAYRRITQDISQEREKEARIQNRIDELIFESYEISSSLSDTIKKDPWVLKSRFAQIDTPTQRELIRAWQLANTRTKKYQTVKDHCLKLQSASTNTSSKD